MPTPILFDSINEENVYQALVRLKLDFEYHIPIAGGTAIRGGLVIDYVVYLPPRPIALFIYGRYWHDTRTREEDEIKEAAARHAGYEVIILPEEETDTVEKAVRCIQQRVMWQQTA